jgi:ABC-type glycerol-3-phosphate transport system substrate-binding protein
MRHWTNALVAAVTGIVAATGASAQQHVLNMLVLSEDAPKIQKVADAYQAKHPDVAIKMQSAPWDQYFQTAELRLNSKDMSVDLVYVDVPLIAGYASRGFLATVDPNLDTSALVPSSLNAGKYDGKLYALPINNSAQVLFYNKKLFADAGVTPPDGLTPGGTATQAQANEIASSKRWTWEQVAEAAQKLTQKKGGKTAVWGFSFDQINELYQLQPLGESLGTDVISPDGKTAQGYLDSPAWVKGATFWSELYNKWGVSPKGLSHDEPPQLFANGQLALFAGGTWNLAFPKERRRLRRRGLSLLSGRQGSDPDRKLVHRRRREFGEQGYRRRFRKIPDPFGRRDQDVVRCEQAVARLQAVAGADQQVAGLRRVPAGRVPDWRL